MNSDFRVSVGFLRHIKTVKLKRRLGADGVLGLMALWGYAAEHKPTGDFGRCTEEDLEIIARWEGEPLSLVNTLLELGFVEREGDVFRIHDWHEHNAWAAYAPERTERAKRAAEARWTGGRKQPCDAPSMLDACAVHAECNAPSPSPSPSPKPKKTFSPDSPEVRLAGLLLERIASRLPGFKQPDLQKWAVEVDRMIRLDGRDPGEIERVIEWSQADPFWKTNILSTGKLREQFDQLRAKMPTAATEKGKGEWRSAYQ